MKKRLLCWFLVIVLLLGLMTGCGSTNLTAEEASIIVMNANDRYRDIFCYFFIPSSEMSLDQTQTLPDDPDMWLVTDERFPNMKAIRDFFSAVVTDEFINKQYPGTFNEEYLSPVEAEEKGIDYFGNNYTTVYYEHEGRLYANQGPPTPPGNLTITDWDNPKIVSQSTKKIVVEYPLLFPHDLKNGTTSYEDWGTITYTVKKENEIWLLDDITEKDY